MGHVPVTDRERRVLSHVTREGLAHLHEIVLQLDIDPVEALAVLKALREKGLVGGAPRSDVSVFVYTPTQYGLALIREHPAERRARFLAAYGVKAVVAVGIVILYLTGFRCLWHLAR
jgi:DNA-binding MarR family transcriptional regulator